MLSNLKISDLSGFSAVIDEQAAAWKDAPQSEDAFLFYGGENANIKYAYYFNGKIFATSSQSFPVESVTYLMNLGTSFYYTSEAQTTQATVKTAPQPCVLTYSGEAQALVTAGEAENGTMQYQIGTSATQAPTGTWSDSVPSQTDAGDYYVWYKAYGSNTDVTEPACVTATIAQKTVTVSGITSNDKAYDKSTTALLITDNAAFDGIVTDDTLTVSAEGAFADANAGDDKTANITGITLGGTSVVSDEIAQKVVQAKSWVKFFSFFILRACFGWLFLLHKFCGFRLES